MYSLLSAAVLAADLAVHPTGTAVVDVLDRALRLTPGELADLGAAHVDDHARQAAWSRVTASCGLAAVAAEPTPVGALAPEQKVLTGSYGGLPELVECLTEDILGWARDRVGEVAVVSEPRGVQASVDMLGTAYAGLLIPPRQADRLAEPWHRVLGDGPTVAVGDGFGPRSVAVRAVIDQLSRAEPGQLEALRQAHHRYCDGPIESRDPRNWSQCMHAGAQAAFLHGRVREVAAAQLSVARAARLAQVPPDLAFDGVLTAVTGVVQAVALADVVSLDVLELLTQGWTDVFGAP